MENDAVKKVDEESDEQRKQKKLNFILLIIGVLVAGISFAWHIIPLFLDR